MNVVRRLWRGEVELGETYWFWNILVCNILVFSVVFIVGARFGSAFLMVTLSLVFYFVNFIFSFAIWRSAGYYKGPSIWRFLARGHCVVVFIFFVISFLSWLSLLKPDRPKVYSYLAWMTGNPS